jgi:glycine hydroxymethyltransferase
MGNDLMGKGYKLITDGTDNHIVMMSCIDKGLTGSKFENACDQVHITLNKNTIIGDKSAVTPGGIRIGTPAVTTRGYLEKDMTQVAEYLDELFKISLDIQAKKGKKLSDFKVGLKESKELEQLGEEVHKFSVQFDIPGFSASKIDC